MTKKTTDKSVRDHSQEACLKGDVIEVTPKLGAERLVHCSFTVGRSEWGAAGKSFTPGYDRHELIKSKQPEMYSSWANDGGENPDRIVDSQVRAIEKLLV